MRAAVLVLVFATLAISACNSILGNDPHRLALADGGSPDGPSAFGEVGGTGAIDSSTNEAGAVDVPAVDVAALDTGVDRTFSGGGGVGGSYGVDGMSGTGGNIGFDTQQVDAAIADALDALLGGTGGSGGTGGTVPTGSTMGTGGSLSTGAGGARDSGGDAGTGGIVASTGGTGSGGLTSSGGMTGSGGVVGTGGTIGTGGLVSTGGTVGTGGLVSTGGTIGTGGLVSTGGTVGTGGVVGSGGAVGTGGNTAHYHVIYAGSGNDGGNPPVDVATYLPGNTVTTFGNIGSMTKSGNAFAGWTTNPTPSGPSASYTAGATWAMGSADVTLYAIWMPAGVTFTSSGTTVAITGHSTCPTGAFVVPPGVTGINASSSTYGFYNCRAITSVTIPSSVTVIDNQNGPFYLCTGLSSFSVDPSNPNYSSEGGAVLDKSKQRLIIGPDGLTSYTIPASVTSIGNLAFAGCSLTSLTVPSNVQSIESGAFDECQNLNSVTLAPGVVSIGWMAFADESLTTITIPATVTSLNLPFLNCFRMTSITVDAGNPNYSSVSGVLYDKNVTTLLEAPEAITSLTIPSTVTTIGDFAFENSSIASIVIPAAVTTIASNAFAFCSSLTSITIPSTVTSIGSSAFYCAGLTGVMMQSATPPTLGASAFSCSPDATYTIHVPSQAAVTAYDGAAVWSGYSSRIGTP